MELADLLSQLNQHDEALRHLNIMVSYAPTYALSHLRLADILAQKRIGHLLLQLALTL